LYEINVEPSVVAPLPARKLVQANEDEEIVISNVNNDIRTLFVMPCSF
jgi:hypothetical protein